MGKKAIIVLVHYPLGFSPRSIGLFLLLTHTPRREPDFHKEKDKSRLKAKHLLVSKKAIIGLFLTTAVTQILI